MNAFFSHKTLNRFIATSALTVILATPGLAAIPETPDEFINQYFRPVGTIHILNNDKISSFSQLSDLEKRETFQRITLWASPDFTETTDTVKRSLNTFLTSFASMMPPMAPVVAIVRPLIAHVNPNYAVSSGDHAGPSGSQGYSAYELNPQRVGDDFTPTEFDWAMANTSGLSPDRRYEILTEKFGPDRGGNLTHTIGMVMMPASSAPDTVHPETYFTSDQVNEGLRVLSIPDSTDEDRLQILSNSFDPEIAFDLLAHVTGLAQKHPDPSAAGPSEWRPPVTEPKKEIIAEPVKPIVLLPNRPGADYTADEFTKARSLFLRAKLITHAERIAQYATILKDYTPERSLAIVENLNGQRSGDRYAKHEFNLLQTLLSDERNKKREFYFNELTRINGIYGELTNARANKLLDDMFLHLIEDDYDEAPGAIADVAIDPRRPGSDFTEKEYESAVSKYFAAGMDETKRFTALELYFGFERSHALLDRIKGKGKDKV